MIRKISNKKFNLILIVLLKCLNSVIFKYPYHKFKLSKIGILFTFLHLILHICHKIRRFILFGYNIIDSTEILNGAITFYDIYKPYMQFASFVSTLIAQKHIYRLFRQLELFEYKLAKNFLKISNNLSFVLILFACDIILSIYIFDGYYFECLLEILAFIPMMFYLFIVYFIILKLESFEAFLR